MSQTRQVYSSSNLLNTSYLLNNQRREKLTLLQDQGGKCIIARMTQVFLTHSRSQVVRSFNAIPRKESIKTCSHGRCDLEKCYLFSLMDRGIQVDEGIETQVTPEKVANYLAKRARNYNLVIDAFAGAGGNAIAFAKESDFVIAIEKDMKRCQQIRHNLHLYGLTKKSDVLCTDYYSLQPRLECSMVFLHPSVISLPTPFSVLTHLQPDPVGALSQAFQMSRNVILLLPGQTPVSEIPLLVHKTGVTSIFEANFSVEIEYIYLNKELINMAVYFGEVNKVANTLYSRFPTGRTPSS